MSICLATENSDLQASAMVLALMTIAGFLCSYDALLNESGAWKLAHIFDVCSILGSGDLQPSQPASEKQSSWGNWQGKPQVVVISCLMTTVICLMTTAKKIVKECAVTGCFT